MAAILPWRHTESVKLERWDDVMLFFSRLQVLNT